MLCCKAYNSFIGNAASGGWSGFAFPNTPQPLGDFQGLLNSDSLWNPWKRPLLQFYGNTARESLSACLPQSSFSRFAVAWQTLLDFTGRRTVAASTSAPCSTTTRRTSWPMTRAATIVTRRIQTVNRGTRPPTRPELAAAFGQEPPLSCTSSKPRRSCATRALRTGVIKCRSKSVETVPLCADACLVHSPLNRSMSVCPRCCSAMQASTTCSCKHLNRSQSAALLISSHASDSYGRTPNHPHNTLLNDNKMGFQFYDTWVRFSSLFSVPEADCDDGDGRSKPF